MPDKIITGAEDIQLSHFVLLLLSEQKIKNCFPKEMPAAGGATAKASTMAYRYVEEFQGNGSCFQCKEEQIMFLLQSFLSCANYLHKMHDRGPK